MISKMFWAGKHTGKHLHSTKVAHFGQVANSSKWCSSGHHSARGPLLTASKQESEQNIANTTYGNWRQLAAIRQGLPKTRGFSIEKYWENHTIWTLQRKHMDSLGPTVGNSMRGAQEMWLNVYAAWVRLCSCPMAPWFWLAAIPRNSF